MEVIKTKKRYLSLLTGKTDMGKSTIATYDCSEKLREGEGALFFSFEYCQSMIYNKFVSHFGLKWQELFRVDVVDSAKLTYDDVENIIRKKASDIDIVYIDYLDLLRMNTYNIEKKEAVDPTKILHFQELLSKLAALAYELSLSIVVLSQESSQGSFEDTIDELNLLTSTIEHSHHIIKMFIGRDNLFSTKIDCNDISHVVLVEGYNLKHFASVNVKQLYKD